jgi:hypothetical protein
MLRDKARRCHITCLLVDHDRIGSNTDHARGHRSRNLLGGDRVGGLPHFARDDLASIFLELEYDKFLAGHVVHLCFVPLLFHPGWSVKVLKGGCRGGKGHEGRGVRGWGTKLIRRWDRCVALVTQR